MWASGKSWLGESGWYAPNASAFTPASLTGLIGWYKADTQVYHTGTTAATNGQTISQWTDQSGNGNHLTQLSTDIVPTWLSAGFNSLPTVQFAAASNTVLGNTAFPMGTGSTLTCFIVGQMLTGTASFGRLVAYHKTAGFNDFDNAGSASVILRDSANNGFATYANSVERETQAMSLATNYRFGVIFDGANITPYLNGVAGTASAYSQAWVSGGVLAVGNNNNDNVAWDGPISEIVICTSDATSQVSALDTYFKTKWGL